MIRLVYKLHELYVNARYSEHVHAFSDRSQSQKAYVTLVVLRYGT